jgi:hypothetical protein
MPFVRYTGFLLLLVLPFPIWGQQTAVDSPQVATILLQSLGSMTGLSSISDVTVTGTARHIAGSDDESGSVVIKALATGQSRIDCTFPSGQSSEIRAADSNGKQAGAWIGTEGTSHAMASHNVMTPSAWFLPALALEGIVSSKNHTVSSVGPEIKDGVSVNHLTIIQPFIDGPADTAAMMEHLTQTDVFLDATTRLLVALDFNIHPDNNALLDIPVEIRYSDYRAVNGAQIPFHVEKYLNNTLILDLHFDAVTLNSGIPVSNFPVQ